MVGSTVFIILSLLGGILSVYFTILVIRIKDFFSKIDNNFLRVNLGALIVGSMIFFCRYYTVTVIMALKEF